ncbi:MAG: hypothetical protein M0P27_10440, partial [Bacteroidales bacterium]|nr:hypothetical protein [Bacteroidales bacterium]
NKLNQYTAIDSGLSAFPTHDTDGNLTWDGQQWAHLWDAENRLIASAPNYWGTTNGTIRIDYTYDYMNRRVSKTTSMMAGRSVSFPPSPLDPQGSWSALETRRYIWDGWNIAAEIIIDQTIFTTNISYYTWGLDLSGTLQGAGGVGGLLCDTKVTSLGTNTYYAFGDANGNVTEYIDNTGAVKAYYAYSAFGETTAQSGSMVNDFTHRFSTKPFDKKTKLIVYELRYYKAPLATWLSRDSIGEQGGGNLYGFVYNNSICLFDVLGREASGGKGGVTGSGGPKKNFNLCKCVVVQKQIVYRNTWFGKLSYDDIFPPNSKPYGKKEWKCPKAYKILITIKPKGGFGNRYQPGGDKCAVWNGETPTGGLGGGMNSLRFKPQVFFSGGNRGNAAPVLWGYYFHPDEGTARETAVEYPIRSGDTSISVSINILDLTENEELGGSAYCRLEAGKSNVSTLHITY